MIQGYVDKRLQAKVHLIVLGKSDNQSTLDAVVDTGFSGGLCISIHAIDKVDLTFSHFDEYELGDGSIVEQHVYEGEIIFDNQKMLIDVLVSVSEDTLIGAALLANKKLEIDYTNKSVRIRNSRKRKANT
jgi:clan AA aspartic protease